MFHCKLLLCFSNFKYSTGKLREFNSNIEASKKLDEAAINGLEGILNGVTASSDNLNNLKSILEWPPSKLSFC